MLDNARSRMAVKQEDIISIISAYPYKYKVSKEHIKKAHDIYSKEAVRKDLLKLFGFTKTEKSMIKDLRSRGYQINKYR